MKAKDGWVDVTVTPDEQETKDWLGKNVKDTVESGFRIGVNDISALSKTPGNGVKEPQEDGPDAANQEGAVYVGTENKSVLACDPNNVPCNTEKSDHAKSVVSPLVRGCNESADKTRNNHDLIEEQSE